jgi:hypothetical protein
MKCQRAAVVTLSGTQREEKKMAETKVKGNADDLENMFSATPDDDLLDSIDDDESEAWMPTEKGEGIVGKVVRLGQTKSDFALPGQDPMVPVVTLEIEGPEGPTQLRVTGYAFLLRKGIEEAAPNLGDTMAFKFLGKGQTKKGQPINKYGVAIRRA